MSFERWLPLDDVPNAIRLRVNVGRDSTATATWRVGDHEAESFGTKRSVPPRGTSGRYNMTSKVAPLQSNITTETPPTQGFLSTVLDAAGNVTFTGRMGDGEIVSGTSLWATNGTVPLHRLLYKGVGGAVNGHLLITLPSIRPLVTSSGRLNWTKKPNAADLILPAGWNPIALDLSGGKYIVPTRLELLAAVLGTTPYLPETMMVLSGGGLPEPLLSQLKPSLSSGFAFKRAVSTISNPKMSWRLKTGTISGSCDVRTGHHVRFYSLDNQYEANSVGFCRVTQPNGTAQLGSVEIFRTPGL